MLNALVNVDMRQFDLEEQIECAVREKGAKAHLAALEQSIVQRQRVLTRTLSIAASFILLIGVCVDLKLSNDIRTTGYAFNPVEGQSGGSEITALMESKEIKAALVKIDEARIIVGQEIADPISDDPDYLTQLNMDSEELDFLEAVCYMRQGKYFKAKKALRAIVSSDGHYSHEAESLLEAL